MWVASLPPRTTVTFKPGLLPRAISVFVVLPQPWFVLIFTAHVPTKEHRCPRVWVATYGILAKWYKNSFLPPQEGTVGMLICSRAGFFALSTYIFFCNILYINIHNDFFPCTGDGIKGLKLVCQVLYH